MSGSYELPPAMVQPELEVYTCAAVAERHNASASRSAREASASQIAPALASQAEERAPLNLEDVLAAILVQAADETRIPDRMELQRATDQQFMVRVFFVDEEDFEPFHVQSP